MHGCMDVDEVEDAPTRAKEKGSQKARTKERRAIKREEAQRERNVVVVERLLMDSVPTAMSLDIGAGNAPTW